MSLKKKFLAGLSWTGTGSIINSGIQFLVIVMLAGFLSASELGAVSIFLIVMSFVSLLSEFGFGSALIQKIDIDINYFSTVLMASILWGICLATGFFLLARDINLLFLKSSDVELITGLKYLSINIFIVTVGQVFRSYLIKNLNFQAVAKIEVFINIVFLLSIYILIDVVQIGIKGFVYSLVLKRLLELFLLGMKARIPLEIKRFSFSHIKELAYYGINITGGQLVTFLANYLLINVIIGRNFGVSALGQYNLAHQVLYVPQQRISAIIARVSFPTFSYYQDDKQSVKSGYLKIIRYLSLIVFPLNLLAFFVGANFLNLLYGDKYVLAGNVLKILAIGGLFKFIITHVGPIIYSQGRADIGFVYSLINFALTILVLEYFKVFGILITILAWVGFNSLFSILVQMFVNRLINIRNFDFIINLLNPIKASAIMLLMYLTFEGLFEFVQIDVFIESVITVIICLMTFALAMYKIDGEIKKLVKQYLKV